MNPNAPFNGHKLHWESRVKAYCAKVLPLVFDNTLSYYESLLHFSHKLNECIDAINAQNLNIIEFTHMVELEVSRFEDAVELQLKQYEEEWETFKTQMQEAFDAFKAEIEAEWEAEKAINEQFRDNMTAAFNTFKNEVNTNFANLRTQLIADLNTFKTNLEEQQDDFEDHILDLQTAFEAREQAARVAYQTNLNNLFEQWKVNTLNAFDTAIHDWETETRSELESYFNLYIQQEISGRIASIQSQISDVSHNLGLERTARIEGDAALQSQINQLTPEGSIKADTPDSDGYSQLYVIDPVTHERENLFPKLKTIEDDRVYFNSYTLDNLDCLTTQNSNITRSIKTNRGEIWTITSTLAQGEQILKNAICIPRQLFPLSDALNTLALLDIELSPIANGTHSFFVDIYHVATSSDDTDKVHFATFDNVEYLVIPIKIFTTVPTSGAGFLKVTISRYLGGSSIGGGGGGSSVTVDSDLSTTSTNPVQNRVITNRLNSMPTNTEMQAALTQKADSSTVSALATEVNQKANTSTVQALETTVGNKISYNDIQYTVNPNTNLPVSSAVLASAFDNKVNKTDYATETAYGLVKVDELVNRNSYNPLANAAIAQALDGKVSNSDLVDAIYADAPDSDGNSQLYKYNLNTETRTNVVPKINTINPFGIELRPTMQPAYGDDVLLVTSDQDILITPYVICSVGFKNTSSANYLKLAIRADRIIGYDSTRTFNIGYATELVSKHILILKDCYWSSSSPSNVVSYYNLVSTIKTYDDINYVLIDSRPVRGSSASYAAWFFVSTI